MDRGTWALSIGGWVYVWPRGERVDVYGAVEYVRRLCGETRDAGPVDCVPVNGFANFEAFRAWCRDEHRCRVARSYPPLPPLPQNSALYDDFRAP